MNVTEIRSKLKFEDFSMKIVCNTAIPFASKAINHAVNANKKLIFAENERTLNKALNVMARSFYAPVFEKFAIQEFYQNHHQNQLLSHSTKSHK